MDRPEISVVIPTLNRWPLLEAALAGVLAQEDVDLEVVVVDDGCTDETPRRLAEHPDPRVVTHRHERPLGVARARNDGIRHARGEWLAFLDDDDRWAPRKLRAQLDAAAAAGASIAFSASIVLDDDGAPVGIDPSPPEAGQLASLLKHNSIPGGCSNLIARADLVERVGGFDERLRQIADWDLWIRLAEHGTAAATPEVLVAYVDHSSSMHVREAAIAPGELAYLQAKHRTLLEAHGAEMGGGAWFLHWVAGGQHRAGDRRGAMRTYLASARRYRSKGALLRMAVGLVSDRYVVKDLMQPLRPVEQLPAWLSSVATTAVPVPPERPGARRRLPRALDGLERVIASALGLSPPEAAVLFRRAHRALGTGRFALRCTAFVVAASGPGARMLPRRIRARALGWLLSEMLVTSADSLGYLGLRSLPPHRHAARGLLAGAPDTRLPGR